MLLTPHSLGLVGPIFFSYVDAPARREATVRKVLLVLCAFALSNACWAQTDKATWENLNSLRPGQKIQVLEKVSGKHSGTFLSVDSQQIKLHEKTGDTAVPRENVARVTVPAHCVKHAVLGLAVGAGAGAAVGAATGGCSNSSTYGCLGASRGEIAAAGAAIGAAIGAIVGAIPPAHKTIYRAP
jgi:hypothetical protein